MKGSFEGRRAAALALTFVLLAPLVAAAAVAPVGAAFDPGVIANTANDLTNWSLANATVFRVNLDNVTPFQCPVNCTITQSDDVEITIEGAAKLTGTFSEAYKIAVKGPSYFTTNYTTIAVVIKGNASDVVMQPDGSAERNGAQAYTKDVNGSGTMNVTLLPSNRTGNITLNVIAYVGQGNRSTYNGTELYAIASKPIEMRAQRLIPLNATIANRANVSVASVNVSFWVKGPSDADFSLVGNSTIAAVNANGQAETGVSWDATWAEPRVYTVKVVIDPLHQHPDVFEENNVAFFKVNLGTPPVDTYGQLVGNAFFWGTLVVIGAIAVGLWFYNTRYE